MLCHWAANQGASGHVWPFDATEWTLAVVAAALLLIVLRRVGLMRTEPVCQILTPSPTAADGR
jgi:hypothetical protein